ncbi:MAG: photosynthetic reaction center subunit H, partial [Pseudomonadota bacterium]
EVVVEAETQVVVSDTVMLPMNAATVSPLDGQVTTPCILAHHFADVPRIKDPNSITLLEEDKIMAYFAAGELYATPARSEPLL